MPAKKRPSDDPDWSPRCIDYKYAGHDMIGIKVSDDPKETRLFSFGVAKAQLILDHIYEITQFVNWKKEENFTEVPDVGSASRGKSGKGAGKRKGKEDGSGRNRSPVEPPLPKSEEGGEESE